GRLVQADNVSDPLESQAFAYDAVGNMTYNSRIGNYVYPSPGQPRPHAPTTINGGSMTYDPNGNLVTGRGRSYTWDWENLPTQINTTQFVYGADRSRLKKLDSGNATLYPLGDDYEIVGGVVTKYVNAAGVGVLGKRIGATPYWSHLDHLGSITLTTDGAGADNLRRTYRPYGDLLTESGAGLDSRGFIDQRQDPETGMAYLHARYYDPEVGVFSAADSLAPFAPGVGVNRYAYAFGAPVWLTDRSGNSTVVVSECQTVFWTRSYGEERQGSERTCETSVFEIVTVTAQVGFDDLRSYATMRIVERAGRGFKSLFGGLLGNDNKDPKTHSGDESTLTQKKPPQKNSGDSSSDGAQSADVGGDTAVVTATSYASLSSGQCQSFDTRLSQNFWMTNNFFPGLTIPTGLGMALRTGRAAGSFVGAPTLWQWGNGAVRGAAFTGFTGGVTFTTAEALASALGVGAFNAASGAAVFEVGVLAGSSAEAFGHVLSCR
ncbi:MAG: RHS repeat-associated core domain-containing protein, partial [Vicinamibacteria bacterium]|nr:RHS repeat-associated core domain-containing protein [Vicinamibacteria bacterium]